MEYRNKQGFVTSIMWMVILCAVVIGAYTQVAHAHNIWLNMDHHYQEVGGTAKIYLAFGHTYPFSDFGDPAKMESYYFLNPQGKQYPIEAQKEKPGTEIKIEQAGTYLAGVEMKPVFTSMTPEGRKFKNKKEVDHCIKCTKHQFFGKTIFYGDKPDGKMYQKVLGHSLEMVPQEDPGLLHQGDYFSIKALFDGKPLKRAFIYATYLGFSTEGAFAYTTRTNSQGIAHIKLLVPGIWYIYLPHTTPHHDQAECDEDSYSSILTVEVR